MIFADSAAIPVPQIDVPLSGFASSLTPLLVGVASTFIVFWLLRFAIVHIKSVASNSSSDDDGEEYANTILHDIELGKAKSHHAFDFDEDGFVTNLDDNMVEDPRELYYSNGRYVGDNGFGVYDDNGTFLGNEDKDHYNQMKEEQFLRDYDWLRDRGWDV